MIDATSLAIEFLCPICHVLPFDPVMAEDGFVYDRRCIERAIAQRLEQSGEITSPMTGETMGCVLITSTSVKETIKELIACEDIEEGLLGAWAAVKREKAAGDVVLNTRVKAKQGDVESMLMLARWYLFGADGFDLDANQGYEWCKLAAQQGNWVAKGYQGGCQILGCGAKENWEDGFELLVEVASQDDSDEARDFAAHTLACYYKHRGTGDKRDMKKVNKWMAKVQKTPMFSLDKSLPWNDSPDGTAESQLYHEQRISEMSGSSMLFPGGLPKKEGYGHDRDDLSEVTATTCSVSNYSSSTSTSSSSGVSSRVCEKCSGALPHPTVDNSYVPAKLCRACKVISSDKFSL